MAGVPAVVKLLRNEEGTSLVELVIVACVSLVLLGAVLSMLGSGTRAERSTQARHSALLDLRAAIVDIDKDTRQATSLDPDSNGSTLDMCAYLDGIERHVVYAVAAGQLTRAQSTSSCSGPVGSAVLVMHVTSATPFCYDYDNVADTCGGGAPTSATKIVHVQLAAKPEVYSSGPITLATDVQLRNPQDS